jgi:hypothetical protein
MSSSTKVAPTALTMSQESLSSVPRTPFDRDALLAESTNNESFLVRNAMPVKIS